MAPISIKDCTGSDWPGLADLVSTWEFHPLSGYAPWPAALLSNHCLQALAKTLQAPPDLSLVAKSQDVLVGLAILNKLPWDSDQLGCSVARVDYLLARGSYWEQFAVKKKLMAMVLQYRAEKNLSFLHGRVNASDMSSLHIFEQAGFITVDGILTFLIHKDDIAIGRPNNTGNMNIRLAKPTDRDSLIALARSTFIYDRFHSDPFITQEVADNLHATWMKNSLAGTAADAVIMAEDDRGPMGFLTCKLQNSLKGTLGKLIGTIVLVGTAKAARGRGVAREMTSFALAWFKQQGADMVEVGTQLRNIPASRLYQSCGFNLVNSSISVSKFFEADGAKRV
jgi:ribosomal protein S18 acetylase RimI-like enzyme